MAQGELGPGYHWPPLYPFFLAGIYTLFGQHIIAVRAVQAVMGAILAVVIAMAARHIGGGRVGALAGGLWSIYPLGVLIAGLVYPTSLITLLLACAVLCLVTSVAQAGGRRRVVLGGILLGLATLTKPIVFATAVALTLWMLYWKRTHRLACATLFLCAVALPLTLGTVSSGRMVAPARSVKKQFFDHLPEVGQTPRAVGRDENASKIQAILQHPGAFASHVVQEFGHFWELYPRRIKMNRPSKRAKYHGPDTRVVRQTVFGSTWTSLVSVLSVGPVFLFALVGAGTM